MNVATGQVIGKCHARHRAREFIKFLDHLDATLAKQPGVGIHIVLDNASTHKTPAVKRWLLRHPEYHLHFTPTSSSWLNQVERFFARIREAQLPAGEAFATKTTLAATMLRAADADAAVPVLAVFDGAYANKTVIRPCLDPANGRRVDVVTRLRFDARLYRPLDPPSGRRVGRPRKWGGRLSAPEHHDRWGVPWRDGAAHLYGRVRKFRVKELPGRWSVTGPAEPVRVFAAEVDGYADPWFLVTTSATLTAAEVVAVFAARFRQEDGFRDHKQRLGMEECRAWTKAPVERTFAVQVVTQTLLRLLGWRLDGACGAGG